MNIEQTRAALERKWEERKELAHHLFTTMPWKFWRYVDRRGDDECWPWLGLKHDRDGRGLLPVKTKNLIAPRLMWMITHGHWPAFGLFVCHHCDNANCVNPRHLFLGTPKDNAQDMVRKDRCSKKPRTQLQRDTPRRLLAEVRKNTPRPTAFLSPSLVIAINADKRSQSAIAAEYGIGQTTVSGIKLWTRWKEVKPFAFAIPLATPTAEHKEQT